MTSQFTILICKELSIQNDTCSSPFLSSSQSYLVHVHATPLTLVSLCDESTSHCQTHCLPPQIAQLLRNLKYKIFFYNQYPCLALWLHTILLFLSLSSHSSSFIQILGVGVSQRMAFFFLIDMSPDYFIYS